MSSAIEIQDIGKRYKLGKIGTVNLRHFLTEAMKSSVSKNKSKKEDFWALKDINLNVNQGEVVGIIGKNGAGKSTLLKILSRVTEPTTGQAIIHGRLASLLEVGTGFHPELTGRENIFLNGSILGMRRKEIKDKLDEIVDFSGIEEFIDTPIKRYSSGMYVRLAFAVAAHLEPEILLVDEVLAVGDLEFQKKCLGKMGDIAGSGRTILFVSHNMGAVAELCKRGIYLENGQIAYDGPMNEAIARYVDAGVSNSVNLQRKNSVNYVSSIDIHLADGTPQSRFDLKDEVCITVGIEITEPTDDLHLSIVLYKGTIKVFFSIDEDQLELNSFEKGSYKRKMIIPSMFLTGGDYHADVVLKRRSDSSHWDGHLKVLHFTVEELTMNTWFKGFSQRRGGMCVFPGEWEKIS